MRKLIEIPTKVTQVDMRTGKSEEIPTTMMMLPAKKGTCEICATKHDPKWPHNQQSLFYQTRFQAENGRPATWIDAMSHCTQEMQDHWKSELRKLNQVLGDE